MELENKIAELILWISGWIILGMAVIECGRLIKKIMKKLNIHATTTSDPVEVTEKEVGVLRGTHAYVIHSKVKNGYLLEEPCCDGDYEFSCNSSPNYTSGIYITPDYEKASRLCAQIKSETGCDFGLSIQIAEAWCH